MEEVWYLDKRQIFYPDSNLFHIYEDRLYMQSIILHKFLFKFNLLEKNY